MRTALKDCLLLGSLICVHGGCSVATGLRYGVGINCWGVNTKKVVARFVIFPLNCKSRYSAPRKKRGLDFKESFSREQPREQMIHGGDRDKWGRKTRLLLWQLNSCCVWGKLLIYGSKTLASYSRGKWAADRSLAEIKSPFYQSYYGMIQFSLIRQSSALHSRVMVTHMKSGYS